MVRCADLRQQHPVTGTFVASNPLDVPAGCAHRALELFWQDSKDSVRSFWQLTELMTCDDQWYNLFLGQCRIGNLHPGSDARRAFANLQHWSSKASMTSQIAAYICLSRVKRLQSMCVMQPFSTFLFAKSNPAGPERLVRNPSGQITEDEIMMSERKNKRMLRT